MKESQPQTKFQVLWGEVASMAGMCAVYIALAAGFFLSVKP